MTLVLIGQARTPGSRSPSTPRRSISTSEALGTLTVSAGGASKVIRVSGAPDIYTVATEQPAGDGTVTIRLSPGLAAYSFTFG